MSEPDYEVEYDNRARVPEHPSIMSRWAKASAALRAGGRCKLDLPYGATDRQRYDLFLPAAEPAGLVVYVHGGYWQRGDRKDYAFVAAALLDHDIAVAVPSYTLAPAASVAAMVGEMRRAVAAVADRTGLAPVVVGHSAGGHMAAMLLATDWRDLGMSPPGLRSAVSLSGVFDLDPLLSTSLNAALGLDAASARSVSPLHGPAPPRGSRFIAAVGALESREFLRQSRVMAEAWRQAGIDAEDMVVPGTNHFTIVDQVTDAGSPLFRSICNLVRDGPV